MVVVVVVEPHVVVVAMLVRAWVLACLVHIAVVDCWAMELVC